MVPVLCLALTAALTGVEASVAGVVHPAINRLSAPARREARAGTARAFGRSMPVLYAICAVAAVGAALLSSGPAQGLWWGAAVALVVVIIGTVVWLVPLNTVIAAGSAGEGLRSAADDDPDAGWEQACDRWDRLHGGRTAVLIVTVLAQLAAIVVAS